jgi:hypothetical protein
MSFEMPGFDLLKCAQLPIDESLKQLINIMDCCHHVETSHEFMRDLLASTLSFIIDKHSSNVIVPVLSHIIQVLMRSEQFDTIPDTVYELSDEFYDLVVTLLDITKWLLKQQNVDEECICINLERLAL